jgi:hypothetical protein
VNRQPFSSPRAVCPSKTFDGVSGNWTSCMLPRGHAGLHDDGCLTWRALSLRERCAMRLLRAVAGRVEKPS